MATGHKLKYSHIYKIFHSSHLMFFSLFSVSNIYLNFTTRYNHKKYEARMKKRVKEEGGKERERR